MRLEEIKELNTERLCLRRFRREDAEVFFSRVGGNTNVTKYMLFEPHKSIEETQASIEKILGRYAMGNAYTWAIALTEDDEVIGRIDLLRFEETESRCSFAYMIGDEFWGKGYGTEALAAVLRYAFEVLELREVVADHMSENVASGAVMRKVGMRHVGVQKARYEKEGALFDADEYRITLEEWRNIC